MIPADTLLKQENGVWVSDQSESDLKKLLGDDPPILLERKTAGLLVQISHIAEKDMCILECQTGGGYKIAEVPKNKVMDAFEHPMLYLYEPNDLFKSNA